MNEIVKADLKAKIIEKLATGESVKDITKNLRCDEKQVMAIQRSDDFLSKCSETLADSVKLASLNALKNIEVIANDKKASAATQLKANQFIVDKALEFNELEGDSTAPSNMSQRQLIDRLQALQNEAMARAKPIDTGVIDIDDMTE